MTAPLIRRSHFNPYELQHRGDITGLRAVAVVPVVLFHAGVPTFSGGYVGVDVFFVISGFLITRLLLRDLAAGTFSISDFYLRRARRILPALFLMLTMVTAAAYSFYTPLELREFGSRLLSSSAFVANIYYWSIADYFAPTADNLELLHLWSVAVEEQFYLFAPPALWAVWKWGRHRLVTIVSALGALSLAVSMYGVAQAPVAAFYLLPARAWELLLGSLLALSALPRLSKRGAEAAAMAGLAALAVAVVGYTTATPFPGLAAVLPCAGAAAIIYAGQISGKTVVARLLSTGPMQGLGLISYSLYIWHWPLLVMPRVYLDRELKIAEVIIALVAAVVLAILTWKYVETPFRTGTRINLRRAGAGVAALVSMALLLIFSGGVPLRFASGVLQAEAAGLQAQAMPSLPAQCVDLAEPERDLCTRDLSIIVWGDSHADHFLPGIQERYPRTRLGRYTATGCPPLPGVTPIITGRRTMGASNGVQANVQTNSRCRIFNETVTQAIAAQRDLKLVIIGGAWQFFSEGNEMNSGEGRFLLEREGTPLSIENSKRALHVGLARAVNAVRATGVPVLILGDVPENRVAPAKCLARSAMFVQPPEWCQPREKEVSRLKFSDKLISELSRQPGIGAFRPSTKLCSETRCAITVEEMQIYRDPDHLSAHGAIFLARAFPDIERLNQEK